MHDVIIIGGSFAGLAAATQLGRARRDVLVLDTGMPRNRFADSAHGFLGHEGRPPAEILTAARAQLAAYGTATIRDAAAVSARRDGAGFSVEIEGGEGLRAHRLILAYGVRDELPDIPGLRDCWGRSVLHCPYCHAYEFADRRLGLLLRHGSELQLARFYAEWSSDLTLLTDGAPVDASVRRTLVERGVRLVETAILRLEHRDGYLRAVIAADAEIPLDALFAHPRIAFSSSIGTDLGCLVEQGDLGPHLAVDAFHRTSVAGVYAAGDIARTAHNLSYAVADGAGAGINAHQSHFEE